MGQQAIRWMAVVVAVLAAGCSGSDPDSLEPAAEDVVIRVIVGDEVAADWTLAELEDSLPFTEISIGDSTERGPVLLDLLTASGVTSWETAEVIGMGEGRSFAVSLDVAASEVDDGWILDVTKQGTLKLAAVELPRERWVRDVAEIRVR